MQCHTRLGILLLLMVALSTACGHAVSSTADDGTITTRVKAAFINDPEVVNLRIDVDTFKGVVTLSGRVNNEKEQQKAIELARTVRGVVDVKSALKIQ